MRLFQFSTKIVLIIFLSVWLSACGGGSSSKDNIVAEEVTVITADPRIAYPFVAKITLESNVSTTEVPVSLYAIDKTSDDNSEAREIPLGTVVLIEVSRGTNDYELQVTIPASLEFPGDYYLSAIVDEAEFIEESSKDDNWASTEVNFASAMAPNIVLDEVTLDRTALIISTAEFVAPTDGDTYNADAGATITVGSDGLALGERVEIEGFASLRLKRNDIGTSLELPLYLWNSVEGRYNNAYGIDPVTEATVEADWLPLGEFTPLLATVVDDEVALDDIERASEHMSFYFPGKLGSVLEDSLRSETCLVGGPGGTPTDPPPDLPEQAISDLENFLRCIPFSGVPGDESAGMAVLDFEICVKIRPSDSLLVDDSSADNEVCEPLDIYLPPLPGEPPPFYDIGTYSPEFTTTALPQDASDGFSTNNSNQNFGFDLDFGAGASADERGFIGEISADVPVKIFGKGFNFVGITVSAQLVPDYTDKPDDENSGFSQEIRHLGLVLDSTSSITPAAGKDLASYSKEKDEEKSFFIGPVPMMVKGTIGAYFGLEYSVGYSSDEAAPFFGDGNAVVSLGASIEPFSKLEAGLEIGIELEAITAGIEGILTLLDERIVYFIGTDIEVIKDDSAAVEFIVTSGQKVKNVFTGPKGKINLFVKYQKPKWTTCKVGIVKYRCVRLREKKKTKNIYTSPALFQREDILYEDPWSKLDVVLVPDKPPAYFEE